MQHALSSQHRLRYDFRGGNLVLRSSFRGGRSRPANIRSMYCLRFLVEIILLLYASAVNRSLMLQSSTTIVSIQNFPLTFRTTLLVMGFLPSTRQLQKINVGANSVAATKQTIVRTSYHHSKAFGKLLDHCRTTELTNSSRHPPLATRKLLSMGCMT